MLSFPCLTQDSALPCLPLSSVWFDFWGWTHWPTRNQTLTLLCVFLLCVSQDVWPGTQPCCLECSQLCSKTACSHTRHATRPLPLPHPACWLRPPCSGFTPSLPTPRTLSAHLQPPDILLLSPSPCPPALVPQLHIPACSPFTTPYLPPLSSFALTPLTLPPSHCPTLSPSLVITYFPLSVPQLSFPQTHCLQAHSLSACPFFHSSTQASVK